MDAQQAADEADHASRSRRANAALLLGSVAFALIVAEGLLRLAAPQNFPIHPRGLYIDDADVGYVLAPGFSGTLERREFRHAVNVGPAGLRGADPRPRGATTFRIVCLGDSFTWGFGVADDGAFPALLEERLARRYPEVDIQVLNAGVPGYGTADALRFFRSRLEMLDPDLVVLTFLAENDFTENRNPALGRVHVEDGWLRAPVPPREQPWQTLDRIKAHSHAARLVSESAGYLVARSGLATQTLAPRATAEDVQVAIDLLVEIARLAGTRGAPAVFMFVSGQAAVISEAETDVVGGAAVAEAARKAGAGHIDLPPLLRARPDRLELYYARDGHWAPAGHAAAAEVLEAYLAEHFGARIAARGAASPPPGGVSGHSREH